MMQYWGESLKKTLRKEIPSMNEEPFNSFLNLAGSPEEYFRMENNYYDKIRGRNRKEPVYGRGHCGCDHCECECDGCYLSEPPLIGPRKKPSQWEILLRDIYEPKIREQLSMDISVLRRLHKED